MLGWDAFEAADIGNSKQVSARLKPAAPNGCIVEVPCRVDDMGIHPYYIGDLPPQCAALNRMNINVQELAVKAIAERSRERVFQAVMVDPLTSAILTIEEIRRMVDEMFEAEREYLPEFE